jgi:hypothetical protein
MVFRPWMYLVLAIGYALCTVCSYPYAPGTIVCGVGTLLCLILMRGAQKHYGRRW